MELRRRPVGRGAGSTGRSFMCEKSSSSFGTGMGRPVISSLERRRPDRWTGHRAAGEGTSQHRHTPADARGRTEYIPHAAHRTTDYQKQKHRNTHRTTGRGEGPEPASICPVGKMRLGVGRVGFQMDNIALVLCMIQLCKILNC